MSVEPDVVAQKVHDAFRRLPRKFKPRSLVSGNDIEWVPLSGIVLTNSTDAGDRIVKCVALGTGMRCLPISKVSSANGRCLHDWHAEIVAIRAFNLFLLQECAKIAADESFVSEYVQRRGARDVCSQQRTRNSQPFTIKADVEIRMYCSEAPCGDASMELTMAAQDDASPWSIPDSQGRDDRYLDGRGFFSELGVVRRKPSRADAEQTLSKSCSDKLALKQCTSLLSSITSLLIHPCNAYLLELILPSSQHVDSATKRAFAPEGRMNLLNKLGQPLHWTGGYSFKPFTVRGTSEEFFYSRRGINGESRAQGTNITACWTPDSEEVLIGGRVAGHKHESSRASSCISRFFLWSKSLEIARSIDEEDLEQLLLGPTYADVKDSMPLSSRRTVKKDVTTAALHGWRSNLSDNTFTIQ